MNNIVYSKEELKEWSDFARAALTGTLAADPGFKCFTQDQHVIGACSIADRMMRARFDREASRLRRKKIT